MRFSRFKQQREGTLSAPRRARHAIPRTEKSKTSKSLGPATPQASGGRGHTIVEGEVKPEPAQWESLSGLGSFVKAEAEAVGEEMEVIETHVKGEPVVKSDPDAVQGASISVKSETVVKKEPEKEADSQCPSVDQMDVGDSTFSLRQLSVTSKTLSIQLPPSKGLSSPALDALISRIRAAAVPIGSPTFAAIPDFPTQTPTDTASVAIDPAPPIAKMESQQELTSLSSFDMLPIKPKPIIKTE